MSLNRSSQGICVWTIIPSNDQKIMVQANQFSRNLGPLDQTFCQTQISTTVQYRAFSCDVIAFNHISCHLDVQGYTMILVNGKNFNTSTYMLNQTNLCNLKQNSWEWDQGQRTGDKNRDWMKDTVVVCPSWHSTVLAQGWSLPDGRNCRPKHLTELPVWKYPKISSNSTLWLWHLN